MNDSMIARLIERLFLRFLNPKDPMYLPKLLQLGELNIGALPNKEFPSRLPRACQGTGANGNAVLSLERNTVSGLDHLTALGQPKVTNRNGNYLLQAGLQIAGPHVPAFPNRRDFIERGIVGPLSLDGIIDFPGIRAIGDFTARQECQTGAPTLA